MPASLRFDPYMGGISRGSFVIDPQDLRAAFGNVGRGGHVYRCLSLKPGRVADLRLVDPARDAIERVCEQYAKGNAELSDFQKLTEFGTGFVLGSLQHASESNAWGFNKLARSFLANLGQEPNCCAEEIEAVVFLGTYDAGFGFHKDAYDTAMFVLDGSKHFLVDVDGEQTKYTLSPGAYLRWKSLYAHTNCNPGGAWSMTLNFTLGPSALRHKREGTPVDYVYPRTDLKHFLDSLYIGTDRRL